MQTEKGRITKDKIIETAAGLFLEKGYHGTGLSDILKKSGMTKGSFYFSFHSKEELATEVAEYYSEQYKNWFEDCLKRSNSWKEFVEILASDLRKQIKEGSYKGCPFASFGTEVGNQMPAVSDVCVKALKEFHHIFCLAMYRQEGVIPSQITMRAMQALTMYEGFLVYYRIAGTKVCIDEMEHALLELK